MPVRSDPETATARWVQGMQGSGDAMKRGVMAVTESPGVKAARAADKWLMKTTAAKDKFARRVGALQLGDWQTAMTSYGISRAGQGAAQKKTKMTAFLQDYLPYLRTGVDKIHQMPKVTLQDSIARAVAMIEHNAAYVRKS